MSITTDPYAAAKAKLISDFYPTPSAGFGGRLLALLALTGYVFAITVTFLVLYYIAMRRQGKGIWVWRLVRKPDGAYITACIYTASVLPTLVATALIGALIANDRDVYVEHKPQLHTFLWRNVIWIIVWLQGWISAYANVQAVLITSTSPVSRWVPRTANVLYIAVPLMLVTGLLVPGIMCSQSWDYVFTRYDQLLVLLDDASAYLQRTGQLDLNATLPMATLQGELERRLAKFYSQYVAMLIVWTVASFLLVAVNITGIVLVVRLRQQVNRGAIPQQADSLTSMPRVSAHFVARPASICDSSSLTGSSGDLSFSYSATMPSTKGSKPDLSVELPPTPAQRVPLANARAMKKLIWDLVITLLGVTFLALVFASDTLLLAVDKAKIYSVWSKAEIAVTLILWAYLIVAGVALTGIAINEACFLYRTSGTPMAQSYTSQDSENASRRRAAVTEAVQITTLREVHVEKFKPEYNRTGLMSEKSVYRVPVPVLAAIPSFSSLGTTATMETAQEAQSV